MSETAGAFDLPFEEAIAFFRQKANVPTKSWRDVWGAAHARAFMVAGAATDALVGDFRAEIDKALAEGTTLAEFRKGFDGIVEAHGWDYTGERNWRTRIIFETNLRTAYAAGQYHQQTRPETLAAFPNWQYNHSGAVHPRQSHLALDGQVFAATDPIWRTHYPPNGYGCGCFVTVLSDAELLRLGKEGLDLAPDLRLPGGGMTGVDPGFAYNPGETWLKYGGEGPMSLPALPDGIAPWQIDLPMDLPKQLEPVTWPEPVPTAALKRMDAILNEDAQIWAAGLSPEAIAALKAYKGKSYRLFNAHLRGDHKAPPGTEKTIETLADALGQARTEQHLVLWRGIKGARIASELKVGETFVEPAFSSTSLSRQIATGSPFRDVGGELWEVRVRKGTRGVAYINHVPDRDLEEYEFLFRPQTLYKVVEKHDDRIVLEVVNETDG